MKYCTPECRNAAYSLAHPKKEKPSPTLHHKECAYCGKTFVTNFPNKKYCSTDCCYEANLKQKREQWAEAYVPRTHICKECGTEFTTECGDTHSVFCCRTCSEKHERRVEHSTDRHKQYMKEQKKRRKKQINAAFVDDVDFTSIFQRDSGICQICGLPVHPVKGIDDNWDGTIDHIVPLSVGGKHSYSNCQLAHRICNSVKRQESSAFQIDWSSKAQENNYWKHKFDQYESLMES